MADEIVKPEEAQNQAQDIAIEVELNKKEESTEKKAESSEAKYVTVEELEKIRKQLNGLSYLGRQFQEVSKKIDTLQPQERQVAPSGTKDPYDEIVEKDWKQAVRILAREEAEIMRQQTIQAESVRYMEQKKVSILEDSKSKVREKYPEIDDQNSELSKRYISILNKNQDYLRNERGPVLAMRDMEDELKSEGRLDEYTRKAVEKEVSRQVRTGATAGVRTQSANGNGNKISLTREQKEICDNNNIRYETYALMLKKQAESGSRQVEV